MTIKYSLTRAEIVGTYFRSLAASREFLARIILYSVGLVLLALLVTGRFPRGFQDPNFTIALMWMMGMFAFMPIWLFLRGKTSERTLTLSPKGISTEIGAIKGDVPWAGIKQVADTSRHVFMMGQSGNAFFIPARAFQSPAHKAKFMSLVSTWRAKAR